MKMKISGTGSALPQNVVTNTRLTEWMDTSDEWIRERTGIRERRISTGETTVSLAADACLKALAQAGKAPEDVDLILVATCSPEYLLPCCACQVQEKIGARNAVAFDINAACSGFLFGLITANAYIQAGMYRSILVVGSEVLSKIMDWSDRSTCILFGDGAGAVLAETEEEGVSGMLGSVQGSDGSRGMVLQCRERLAKNPMYKEEKQFPGPSLDSAPQSPSEKAMEEASENTAQHLGKSLYVQMDGQAVFKFAVRQVPACINRVLEKTGLSTEDIDLFILHQANVRILEAVGKRLGTSMDKIPMNLDRVGNMSSASIPVLLDELNRSGRLHRGDKLVLSGFGAGLTYGSCVIVW